MSATTAREVEEFMRRAWTWALADRLADRLCDSLAGSCVGLNPEETTDA